MEFKKLLTEARNPNTIQIDSQSSLAMVELINQEDHKVATAIQAILPTIAAAVDLIVAAMQAGGRLFYLGAGTSGRLGILDAAECPPTYGTDPNLIIGLIAGGPQAILQAVEGAEDSLLLAAEDLRVHSLQSVDIVIGIAASGRTPYVIGGLQYAASLGCRTISLSCTPDSELGKIADLSLTVLTGPEVIMGSTRMKAGTAQKMVLNMLTTATMISLGKVYSNLMVDVQATNVKLQERAKRIVTLATNVDLDQAAAALTAAGGSAKLAIVMLLTKVAAVEANHLLHQANGFVSGALAIYTKRLTVSLRKTDTNNDKHHMFTKLFTRFSAKPSQAAIESDTAVLVYAPLSGQIIALEQVADPVFSQKLLGEGTQLLFIARPSN